jgi:hypothetical protein
LRCVEAQLDSAMFNRFSLAMRNECKVKTKGLGDVYMSNSLHMKKNKCKIKFINFQMTLNQCSNYLQSLLRHSQSPTRANSYCYRPNVSTCRILAPTTANCSALCRIVLNRTHSASSICTLDYAKHKLDKQEGKSGLNE